VAIHNGIEVANSDANGFFGGEPLNAISESVVNLLLCHAVAMQISLFCMAR
jgi:hypothetical protein